MVLCNSYCFTSVQFSRSVVSDSLRPHELQHTRLPCPPSTPGVHPNPCPLSRWCHPTISSSVIPFSSCLQSFPASGSFQMSQLFASGGQSIGVSASASVFPMNKIKSASVSTFPPSICHGKFGCCKLLGARILCAYNCLPRSGHNVTKPPTRQTLFSVLQILSLHEWKSVILIKVRPLRMGYPVFFRL